MKKASSSFTKRMLSYAQFNERTSFEFNGISPKRLSVKINLSAESIEKDDNLC